MNCADEPIPYRGRGPRKSLTADQERQVIRMYVDTKVPVAQIATAFSVCRKTIYNVLSRSRMGNSGDSTGRVSA